MSKAVWVPDELPAAKAAERRAAAPETGQLTRQMGYGAEQQKLLLEK